MSSKLGVQNIAHTNGTNAMTVSSGGVATFLNPPVGAFIPEYDLSLIHISEPTRPY